jgi:hypothetical protein
MANDHYVPVFYLTHFAIVQRRQRMGFWVYDKTAQDAAARFQTPVNTAAIGNLNTFPAADGSKIRVLEAAFSEIEDAAAPVVRRWLEPRARPLVRDVEVTADFVATLWGRVPRTVETMREFTVAFLSHKVRAVASDPERLGPYLAEVSRELGKPVTAEQVQRGIQLVEEGKLRLSANEKKAQLDCLSDISSVMRELFTMNWCICVAPTGSFFITCDAPVSPFVRGKDGHAAIGGGFGIPSVEVTLPLSPTHCLLLDRKHNAGRMRVGKAFVDEVNRRTAYSAERFVISPYDTKQARALVDEFKWTVGASKVERAELERTLTALDSLTA